MEPYSGSVSLDNPTPITSNRYQRFLQDDQFSLYGSNIFLRMPQIRETIRLFAKWVLRQMR
jgi:hypothetical protein